MLITYIRAVGGAVSTAYGEEEGFRGGDAEDCHAQPAGRRSGRPRPLKDGS